MAPQIFKATYSGVPVYEMIYEGVSVMRRREDGWLNATQILKVAGFDKPQRTRVLEREVQKGVHEKVQGGYGKYQGTWVPPEAALAIARQYEVEVQLRPIIDYRPSASDSPPPAPKHTVGGGSFAPTAARHRTPSGYSSTRTRSARRHSASQDSQTDGFISSADDASMASETPSPVGSRKGSPSERQSKKRKRGTVPSPIDYADIMLEYFISDSAQIPEILITPPTDFNPDITIDDDNHTALHWAAAMGRIRVVKLLLSAGADPFKTNKSGQTALMRAVMFANNYDIRKFAELYELLHRTTLNIDTNNRTVFHHIVDLALTKGKTHAARYYMEAALARFAEFPKELADIINFQDQDGDTALTMAARCRSKRLVKALLDHGSDPNLRNRDNKSAEDYILDDEKLRASPTIASRAVLAVGSLAYRSQGSAVMRRASGEVFFDMTQKFDDLLRMFFEELTQKERDIAQINGMLTGFKAEMSSNRKSIEDLKQKAGDELDARKELLKQMDAEMMSRVSKRCRIGFETWQNEEIKREDQLWNSDRGITKENISNQPLETLQGSSLEDNVTDIAELYAHIPTGEEELSRVCGDLKSEVEVLQRKTEAMIKEYAQSKAETTPGGKIADYKRLLAGSLSGVPTADVDNVVAELLKTLEAT